MVVGFHLSNNIIKMMIFKIIAKCNMMYRMTKIMRVCLPLVVIFSSFDSELTASPLLQGKAALFPVIVSIVIPLYAPVCCQG